MREEEKWIHSACAMCVAAPMKVKVKGGRVVEIAGEDLPGWEGSLCGKALAGIGGRIYAPDRILHPLKRVGERGEGRFVRCSWEEVIEAVASKLKEYMEMGHPEYFEIWWGCPYQQDNIYFIHYWCAVTGAGISYIHGQVCFGDHQVEKTITFGEHHGPRLVSLSVDWLRTRYAVIAGMNFPGTATMTAHCNIPVYKLVNKARENGCRFVVIDPKLTDTAPWCDEWIPIKPGTDAAFALGIAHVLIKEKLYDEDFLLRYTNAPQLINVEDGRPLKDGEGRYLAWNLEEGRVDVLPKPPERGGLTLGLGRTLQVSWEGRTIQCKTAFQLLA